MMTLNRLRRATSHQVEWHSFFWGFFTAAFLASLVVTMLTVIPGSNEREEQKNQGTTLMVSASPGIAVVDEEISLNLILSGKGLSHPITYVWSADFGTGLPVSPTVATQATWTAPGDVMTVEIRAVAVDSRARAIMGKVILQVVRP